CKSEGGAGLRRAYGQQSEPKEIASVLNQLVFISDALGDRQKAINYFTQALPFWRAGKNRQSEAETLAHIGRIYNTMGDKKQANTVFDKARLIVRTSSILNPVSDGN